MKKVKFLSLMNIGLNIAIFGIYGIAGIYMLLRIPSASQSFYRGLLGSAAIISLAAVVLTIIMACKLPPNVTSRVSTLSIANVLCNFLLLAFIVGVCLNMHIGGSIIDLFFAGIYLAMISSGFAIVFNTWLKKDVI